MTIDLSATVREMLSRDDAENYSSADAVAESVQSEIEQTREITDAEASTIGELCEEWFAYEA